jgi:hypothetical protein
MKWKIGLVFFISYKENFIKTEYVSVSFVKKCIQMA